MFDLDLGRLLLFFQERLSQAFIIMSDSCYWWSIFCHDGQNRRDHSVFEDLSRHPLLLLSAPYFWWLFFCEFRLRLSSLIDERIWMSLCRLCITNSQPPTPLSVSVRLTQGLLCRVVRSASSAPVCCLHPAVRLGSKATETQCKPWALKYLYGSKDHRCVSVFYNNNLDRANITIYLHCHFVRRIWVTL